MYSFSISFSHLSPCSTTFHVTCCRCTHYRRINRPGGCGIISQIHCDPDGAVESLDVKYTVYSGSDTNLDPDLVQPFISTSRRVRRPVKVLDPTPVDDEENKRNRKPKKTEKKKEQNSSFPTNEKLTNAKKASTGTAKAKAGAPDKANKKHPLYLHTKKKKIKPQQVIKNPYKRKKDDDDELGGFAKEKGDVPREIVIKAGKSGGKPYDDFCSPLTDRILKDNHQCTERSGLGDDITYIDHQRTLQRIPHATFTSELSAEDENEDENSKLIQQEKELKTPFPETTSLAIGKHLVSTETKQPPQPSREEFIGNTSLEPEELVAGRRVHLTLRELYNRNAKEASKFIQGVTGSKNNPNSSEPEENARKVISQNQ
jgi:hypothetical protein